MKRFALVAALCVAGCSGMSYAIDNYGSVKPVPFQYQGQTFRMFDKPVEGRLMITPSNGAAFAQGATFGAAGTAERTYEQAAMYYLSTTGRDCRADRMALVLEPQWEVFYSCQ